MPETTPGLAASVDATAAASPPSDVVTSAGTALQADRTMLLAALAESVLAVPGVVRLEPTLSTAGPGLLVRRAATDGIRLLLRPGTAQVDIDVATRADCQARTVAHQIRASATSVLLAHGCPGSSITVSVLTIEPVSVM